MQISMVSNGGDTPSMMPGFRFHPTDEELLHYYLRRKVCGKPFRFDCISEIDIYKAEPWDLPGKSKLKTKDMEWYFFSVLEKKYGKVCRTNRATYRGYWKTTGNDRAVLRRSLVTGMKKTLVYHFGRAPKGERTNWVMHEYRLTDEELGKAGIVQAPYVLCRVFQKSGPGPKNGERYGAPLALEEWEDEEFEMFPKEADTNRVIVGNDDYSNGNFLEQVLAAEVPTFNVPPALELCFGQGNDYPRGNVDRVDDCHNFFSSCKDDICKSEQSNNHLEMVLVGSEESGNAKNQQEDHKHFGLAVDYSRGNVDRVDDCHNFFSSCKADLCKSEQSNNHLEMVLVGPEESGNAKNQQEDQKHFGLPVEEYDGTKSDYFSEPISAIDPNGADYFLGEQFSNAVEYRQNDDEAFLDTYDLSNPIDVSTSCSETVDGCLSFFDTNGDFLDNITFDQPLVEGSEGLLPGEAALLQIRKEDTISGISCQQLLKPNAESPKQAPKNYGTDSRHPFTKQASRILGNIPAPPAFALEFPSKNAAVQLNSVSRSSSTVHISADMIEGWHSSLVGHGTNWFTGNHGVYNVMVALGLLRDEGKPNMLNPMVRIVPGKTALGMSSGWFCFFLFWVLILSISFKLRTLICAV